ncbi:MT-A70-domain-containing protein [Cyathus striatus]|nr:MT-A70-domain-containing protein [Cyathus striatus]
MAAATTGAITSANELLAEHFSLILRVRSEQQDHRRQLHSFHSPPLELLRLPLIHSPSPSPPPPDVLPLSSPADISQQLPRADLPPAKRARMARYKNYVPEEETIRNDYSQRYVDGGEWPQNWVLGAEPEHRFEEYPKQQRLLNLKKAAVSNHALPPSYLPLSNLTSLHPCKFDVILLDPSFSSSFTWEHLQELPIPNLAADPSFIFLWIGSGAGDALERGREVLARWGYRRCEDVVWVKTNKTTNMGPGTDPPTTSLLTRTKQHCLMGIRGTVRRSTDSWFVHCNVDTDVIIWEGDPMDPTRKPPEMYTLIENFCLGLRRLEIFGRLSSLRRGWVTALGADQYDRLPISEDGSLHVEDVEGGRAIKWEQRRWEEGIKELSNGGKPVVPMTHDIDHLRPKSPVRHNQSLPATGPTPPAGISNNRFSSGNRPGGFTGNSLVNSQAQLMQQNQLMVQPMMGMGVHQFGVGMGPGVPVEEVLGGWNPLMGGNINGLTNSSMGNVGVGIGAMNMNMMGQMGMGAGFQGQSGGFSQGMPMFNNGWAEQAQFNMESGWDMENMMNMNASGVVGGMGMNGMNINGMGIPSQWPGRGNGYGPS